MYSVSVNPTIVGGDNPEVITGAVQLGLFIVFKISSHNTIHFFSGSHLFSKLFSFIGNYALVLNYLSVLFACASVYYLTGTVFFLTNGNGPAALLSSSRCRSSV